MPGLPARFPRSGGLDYTPDTERILAAYCFACARAVLLAATSRVVAKIRRAQTTPNTAREVEYV